MMSHGVLKLPPGFRFHPTDEELVIQYLRRRALSIPLPAAIISDIDICKYDPWDLPGDGENAKYFFTRKETKYPNGKRSNRACASGYWKATGKDRAVHASRSNLVVGMKKSLVFYRGKAPKGAKTEWVMHEYRLSDFGLQPFVSLQMKNSIQIPMEDWVLCRIFQKKTAQRRHTILQYMEGPCNMARPRSPARPVLIDFMMENQRDSETSSASSSITEVSSCEASDSGDSISSSKRE
ncbi:NAC domain-containing protein 83-like [Nymphaea colorata]|nr:NAC domain-containing protein 83-like [Nymphaea colorata]